MKKTIALLAIVSIAFVGCKEEKKEKVTTKEKVEVVKKDVASTKGNINVATSTLYWKGTKPTGFHDGNVAIKSGNLVIENGKVTGGEFIINMNNITCLDIKDDQSNADLVGHLKGKDFFEVAKYPTAKFMITAVQNKDDMVLLKGNLTIKEVTKSITIPARLSAENGVTTLKSEPFKFNRTDYGIQYKSKSFFNNLKNKFIDDLVEMSFTVTTK